MACATVLLPGLIQAETVSGAPLPVPARRWPAAAAARCPAERRDRSPSLPPAVPRHRRCCRRRWYHAPGRWPRQSGDQRIVRIEHLLAVAAGRGLFIAVVHPDRLRRGGTERRHVPRPGPGPSWDRTVRSGGPARYGHHPRRSAGRCPHPGCRRSRSCRYAGAAAAACGPGHRPGPRPAVRRRW